jgi:hypothetical protein
VRADCSAGVLRRPLTWKYHKHYEADRLIRFFHATRFHSCEMLLDSQMECVRLGTLGDAFVAVDEETLDAGHHGDS